MQFQINTKQCAALAGLILAAYVNPALAQKTQAGAEENVQYYGGIQLGQNDVNDWKNQVQLGAGVKVRGRVLSNGGNMSGIVLGRQTTGTGADSQKSTRYELEYQRGSFDVQGVEVGAFRKDATDEGKYQALTLNAYRQHAWNDQWSGYAGLGLGWGKGNMPFIATTASCNCVAEASKSGLVLLARVGVEYRFNKQHNAFAQYTLLNLQGPTSGGIPGVSYSRKWIGAAAIGYRYMF